MHDPILPDGARRATLLRLSALCGLAAFGIDAGALAAATAKPAKPSPALLTPEELRLTGVLADLVIPRTDTPGALDVGTHLTIDHLLHACAPAPAQAGFRAGLARIDAAARAEGGKPFAELGASRQAALLQALDAGRAPFAPADRAFFRQLKGAIVFAYYTSEAGATRELAYLPVPGGFKGDLEVKPDTRTWAI